MATSYAPAEQIETIAKDLIRDYHRHLLHVDMRYVFKSKASKCNGKVILGKARKVTGLNAFLGNAGEVDEEEVPIPFFLIEVGLDTWVDLSPSQQTALVDHELCHCGVDYDDNGAPVMRILPHDLEAFRAEIERHGLWKPDVESFAESVRQLSLIDASTDAVVVVREETTEPESGIQTARAALDKPDPQEEAEPMEAITTAFDDGEKGTTAPPEEDHGVADLSTLHGERIDPEPIPPEARAAARRGGDGPEVVPFNPSDVKDLKPPSERTAREAPSNGKRDEELAKFLAER